MPQEPEIFMKNNIDGDTQVVFFIRDNDRKHGRALHPYWGIKGPRLRRYQAKAEVFSKHGWRRVKEEA